MTDGVKDENFGFDIIGDGISMHQISWTFKCRVSSHVNYLSTYSIYQKIYFLESL